MITEGNRPQLVKRARDATVQEQQARRPQLGHPEDGARGRAAQQERADDRGAPRRPGPRRHRRRADLPEQGPAVLGDARPGVRRRDVPGVEPLGLRLVRRRRRLARRPLPPAGVDRHRRRRAAPSPRRRGRPSTASSACASATARSTGRSSGATSSTTTRRSRSSGRSIDEAGLPLTFHVSTGRDPRAVGGNGGAIINYVCHCMETTIEPLVQLITSGVFERHPGPAGRPRRVRHRLRAVAAGDDGLRLPGPPHVGPPGDPRAAVDVLQAQLLRHVPGGPRRPRHRRAVRPRRQPDVGQRLSPPRGFVAVLGGERSSARWATLSDDSRAKILGLNAQRIFGL